MPSFTARLLKLGHRIDESVLWTDIMLNGRGITYHDVEFDITRTVDVADLGRTFNPDPDCDPASATNGKFCADTPYPDLDPAGTYYPGGDGSDFGLLLEAEVTIPVGRWQIAFGSDAGGWIHLRDPREDGPLTTSNGEPVPNPFRFFDRKNENESLHAGFFQMFESALWHNGQREFGWTGGTFDTRVFDADRPVTTTLRAFVFETDGLDALEIVVRDTDDGRVVLDRHIGANNTLFPDDHDWRLLQDGVYSDVATGGWQVRPAPVTVEIERSPENPDNALETRSLTLPVLAVGGKHVIGPASYAGELIIRELPEPDATPVHLERLVKARRYYVPDYDDELEDSLGTDLPDFDNFSTVEKARAYIDDPDNPHREPVSQGFVDVIAWRSGDFYPPAFGFPVRDSLSNSPNEYGVLIEGELLLPPNQRTIRFKDANDRFAGFVLDLDGDGDLADETPIIDDADPANDLEGRGSPIAIANIGGSVATREDRWRRFEFYMADDLENDTTNRFLNADSGLLAWDQNVSGDVFFPAFPTDPAAPLSPEHVIGPENFRARVEPILDGELLLNMDEFADPMTREITLVFEVDASAGKWDSIGIRDTLQPDYVIGDPNRFFTKLDFGNAEIVVDIVEGRPTEGFTIDLVDETVDTILIEGLDANQWELSGSTAWHDNFLFTFGQDAQWDLSNFLHTGMIRFGEFVPIEGDYNNSGVVEQGDLDLVLLNWGQNTPPIPDGWVNDLPDGRIDQQELDGVLLNWGNRLPASSSAVAVPEPSGLLLACLFAVMALVLRQKWRVGASLVWEMEHRQGRTHITRPARGPVAWSTVVRAFVVTSAVSSTAFAQTGTNGFTGRLLDVATVPNEHAEALAFLLGIGLKSPQVQADVFDLVARADFGGSHRGDFFIDDGDIPEERGLPYPGGDYFPGDDAQSFVVSLEAEVTIPAGTWQIAFGTGDGGAIRIEGVHFSQRFNDVDRMVGSFFNLDHDLVIYDNNRGRNDRGSDRGWTGGTFTVGAPRTTRLIHTFHQTPHGLGDNHLSEVIIRNANASTIVIDEDVNGQEFIPLVSDGWTILEPGVHGWQVRSTLDEIVGPVDPARIGPIDHLGGRGLVGSVAREDPRALLMRGMLGGIEDEERNRRLLVRRYTLDDPDDPFDPPFPDSTETVEERAETNRYIADWIEDREPDHLGYISHVQWKSDAYYPEGLGFDDPYGDQDNYLVAVEGQLFISQHDLNEDRRKQIRFKDGTADYSGLVLELGDEFSYEDSVRDVFWDAVPSDLDGTGSPIRTAEFAFSDRVVAGDKKGWVDFTYYMYAQVGDDNALLAWDEYPLISPGEPTDPLGLEHVIQPENFRLRNCSGDCMGELDRNTRGGGGGRIILAPELIETRPADPNDPMGRTVRVLRIEADLATFRDDEPPVRSPMVVFEIDPLTGRSDTIGVKKIDPEILTGNDRDVIQEGILDVDGVHILVDALSIPVANSTFDLVDSSVAELIGTPQFRFRVAANPALNNPAFWDTSQFALEGNLGRIRFRGISATGAAVPEPSTRASALLLVMWIPAILLTQSIRRRRITALSTL